MENIWQEKLLSEKHLGTIADHKLNVSQQLHAAVVKKQTQTNQRTLPQQIV